MATPLQVEANCCNSQKSTGPRTPEGKAVTRFNALKTGIHAQSHVIPGEDAAELAELADGYHQQFHPATPAERFLIDTLVASEWQLRRLHKAEAQLWQHELNQLSKAPEGAQEEFPLACVFSREIFARIAPLHPGRRALLLPCPQRVDPSSGRLRRLLFRSRFGFVPHQ